MTGRSNAPSEDVSGRSSNYYDTLSETAEMDAPKPQIPAPQLSKKDRKKLKKLKKRAAHVMIESERSGLLTRSEYEEYQALIKMEHDDQHKIAKNDDAKGGGPAGNTKLSPGTPSTNYSLPSANLAINLRKKCLEIEKVEGVTHRDLLSWLLQQRFDRPQQQLSRKRQRDDGARKSEDVVIALPHWASVHNPGTCEQVAVLEVHLPDDKIDPYCRFLESCQNKSKTQDNESKNGAVEGESERRRFPHSQIGVATKWFQGHMPKSLSDSLLYFSNAKKEQKTNKNDDASSFPSRSDFIKRLETLLLSQEEMKEQGYPSELSVLTTVETAGIDKSEACSVVSRKEKFQSPDSISLESAKAYSTAVGVRVESQNEEDKNLYVGTPTNNGDDASKTECPVRALGLDCEMVLTTVGSELARVTLLEFNEFVCPKTSSKTTVLLDCLVRPENTILDYLTKHSGITPSLLEPVSTRLEQVQCALASYLTPNDILIGHSLENDLRALHYIHPRIVDTSMIFRPLDLNKRFKFSLRHLSGTLLKRPIQTGSHCSEEDAQTALDLALLKALKGDDLRVPGFGDNQRQSLLRQSSVKQSIAAFIGPSRWLEAHVTKHPNGAHALNYDSPNDCKKAMLAWMTNKRKAQLVWANIELGNKVSSGFNSEADLEVFKSIVVRFATTDSNG
jgi:hypothetical protein